jgi:probable rRNA maturation factor
VTVELIGEWPDNLSQIIAQMLGGLDGYEQLELPAGIINLKLVDDAEIAALNEQYSGNAYATDVLTFTYGDEELEGDPEDAELADIVISTETATRQAEAAGTDLESEVALLALHGILHAIGLDHQTKAARQRVETYQTEILKRANIPYREFKWEN